MILEREQVCLNQTNKNGDTALIYAIWFGVLESGHINALKMLLQKDSIDINGITMLSEEKGHIFVGQATQWKDRADIETIT